MWVTILNLEDLNNFKLKVSFIQLLLLQNSGKRIKTLKQSAVKNGTFLAIKDYCWKFGNTFLSHLTIFPMKLFEIMSSVQ